MPTGLMPIVGFADLDNGFWLIEAGVSSAPQPGASILGGNSGYGFWSWKEAADVARFYRNRADWPAVREYVDLGAPVSPRAPATQQEKQDLDQILYKFPLSSSPKHVIAIVDQGVPSPSGPDHFNHRIDHVRTQSIDWSQHALRVMRVLCDQLLQLNLLSDVHLVCSLFDEPPDKCVDLQSLSRTANVVDIETAIDALDHTLQSSPYSGLQQFVNLSLGSHLGPHDGSSPFESKVAALAQGKQTAGVDRFVLVAAGNEGLDALSQRIETRPGEAAIVRFRIGAAGAQDFLFELWWEDDQQPFQVEIAWSVPGLSAPVVTQLDRQTQGGALIARHKGNFVASWSAGPQKQIGVAIAGACHANAPASDLAGLSAEIAVTTSTARRLFAWRVFPTQAREAYFEGLADRAPSLAVPATADQVICVGGHDASNLPWNSSSVGPLANYQLGGGWRNADLRPHISHHVAGPGTSAGTSFAAPRACANSVAVLPSNAAAISDLIDALRKASKPPAHSTHPGSKYPFHERLGFGTL
jgi:hypothetical protein